MSSMLLALLGLVVVLTPGGRGHAQPLVPGPQAGTEVFGYVKGDRAIVHAQMEMAVSHLKTAIAQLEGFPDVLAIQRAEHIAHLSYRMMRFATQGIRLLDTRPAGLANPIHEIVTNTLWKARYAIIRAERLLAAGAEYPTQRAASVENALGELIQALAFAEEALLLS